MGCDGALVEGGKDSLRGFEAGGFPEDVEHEGLFGVIFRFAFGLVEELLKGLWFRFVGHCGKVLAYRDW